jgi:hypothetical protein
LGDIRFPASRFQLGGEDLAGRADWVVVRLKKQIFRDPGELCGFNVPGGTSPIIAMLQMVLISSALDFRLLSSFQR